MTDKPTQLKPCPFCGGEAIHASTRHSYPAEHWVKCSYCFSATTAYGNREAATIAWNTRADATEFLREALQQTKDTLVKHHQWHAAQIDEDEHGIVPADAYNESALYDQTVRVLGIANLLLTDGMMNTASDAHLEGEA